MWKFALVLFSYLPLSLDICVLFVLFHMIVWYTLLVWLSVSSHVISVSAHIIYLVDISIYQHHFMFSWSPLLIQDYLWYSINCDKIRSTDQLTYFLFEDRGHILCIVFISSCWWLFRPELFWILRTSRCDISLSMGWLIQGLIWT